MKTRERRLLEQLLKQWAQDHTIDYTIADFNNDDHSLKSTQEHFTWLIGQGQTNIDLFALADKIEHWLETKRKRKYPDGLKCKACHQFFEFAESNQEDGSLICYGCRQNPYI